MQVIATIHDRAETLAEFASTALRSFSLPADAEIAVSIVSHPSFSFATAYHIAVSVTKKSVVGACLRRRWDAQKDLSAFNNPLERLKFLNGYALSFDETEIARPTFDAVTFLADLLNVPLAPSPLRSQRSISLDGYFYELALRTRIATSVFAWGNQGPMEWRAIADAQDAYSGCLSRLISRQLTCNDSRRRPPLIPCLLPPTE